MTLEQWNKLVEQQRALLNNESVEEDVKQDVQQQEKKKATFVDVSNIDWNYFNLDRIRNVKQAQTNVKQAPTKAQKLKEKMLKNQAEVSKMTQQTQALISKTSLSTQEDLKAAAMIRMETHNKD